MTREEAILRLRVQREQAADVLEKFQKGIYGHGGKVGVAIDTAIAALRGPQPDPKTGLVPCGCGGTPRIESGSIVCHKCGISVRCGDSNYINHHDSDREMKEIMTPWNRAMGRASE